MSEVYIENTFKKDDIWCDLHISNIINVVEDIEVDDDCIKIIVNPCHTIRVQKTIN